MTDPSLLKCKVRSKSRRLEVFFLADVIGFDLPFEYLRVHSPRVGSQRTGRAGRAGVWVGETSDRAVEPIGIGRQIVVRYARHRPVHLRYLHDLWTGVA